MWKRAWFWGTGLLLVALGVGAYVTKQTGDDVRDEKSDTATLIAQIKAGSEGWVQGANVFGGELKSQGEGSRHAVLVTKIPSKVCVEAGLALAKDGIITVNGVMPPRVSAGKLAVLCNEGGNESTLSWVPR
jgi:ribosomal protein L19